MTTDQILENAKSAKAGLFSVTTEQKNTALKAMAKALCDNADTIIKENALDLEASKGKISDVMLDRLMLSAERIEGMAKGILEVAELPDPTGRILAEYERENGLKVQKVSVPIGVVAIIYESRPNVTSDAAALTLKSGNVCILRSGKEAYRTSKAIVNVLRDAISSVGLNENLINIIDDTTRDSANALMKAEGYVDLLIPRGGKGLISACVKNATVPCIETGTGICHIFVDKDADFEKALNIIENAKMSRPSVCNAAEVCLVHKDIAEEFLPLLYKRLCTGREKAAELRLDEQAAKIIEGTPAGENDFDTEFLDYIMAVKVVNCVNCAIKHISLHSTHHSDAIITENKETAAKFTAAIDSAAVYVNASTRFTDGGVFGLGCEMGISTQKLHARGPMGLCELNTYKYIVSGNGQIR